MVAARDHVRDPCIDGATCLSFSGPAGRTELIRGRRLAGIEAAVCSPDHAVFARFSGASTDTRHSISGGPQRSGAIPGRHMDVLPAGRRLICWDAGVEQVEYLAVFLPQRVLEGCTSTVGGPVRLRPGLGVRDADLWATLCKIKRAVERPHDLQAAYHGQLLSLLAMELASRHSLSTPRMDAARGGLSNRHTRLVKDHLAEHFARPVPLAELAALVHLNRSHLCEAFRQATGLAPHQFQTARRIEHAKRLLAEASLPLAEVAMAGSHPVKAADQVGRFRLVGGLRVHVLARAATSLASASTSTALGSKVSPIQSFIPAWFSCAGSASASRNAS